MQDLLDLQLLEELRSVGGDELILNVASSFVDANPTFYAAVESAARALDHVALARAAHRLKGHCASIGAARAAALCLRLETGARRGCSESVTELVRDLRTELSLVQHELGNYIARPQGA